jgi:hypothetical protein
MNGPPYTLWVEALSSVRTRAEGGQRQPLRYRVRGLPRDYDIRIVEDPGAHRWRMDRGSGELEGDYASAAEALAALQGEFDSPV